MYTNFLSSYKKKIKVLLTIRALVIHGPLYYSMRHAAQFLLFMKRFCIALAVMALAICAVLFPQNAPLLLMWLNQVGYLTPILFLFIYCFATIFFLPTMILTFVGGALFGPVFGTLFNVIGATLGAICAFIISRYFLFEWVASKQNKKIKQLMTGVERWGWQFAALLRIVPIIPFNLVNYGLGLTHIKFSHYVITTIIFLIPLEIASTYCGYIGMDFLLHSSLVYKKLCMLILTGIMVSFLIIPWIKRKKKSIQ